MKPNLLPKRVLARITDRDAFELDLQFLSEMKLPELRESTENHLRNLGRIDADFGADFDLRAVLVPEIWERLEPGSRTPLRRITTSLAEYNGGQATSVFRRLLGEATQAALLRNADELRKRIEATSRLDRTQLVEMIRFAIAGSTASERFAPSAYVYEPAFVYRLVPELARRCP